jgi:hypothetical protein
MKQLLAAEQATQFVLAIMALYLQPIHINAWLWLPLFLSPDLSMLGYLFNNRVGAITYNVVHHKLLAGIAILAGVVAHLPLVLFIGILLWGHSAFDRMMGYGLKYYESFNHTHLGLIGKLKGKPSANSQEKVQMS